MNEEKGWYLPIRLATISGVRIVADEQTGLAKE